MNNLLRITITGPSLRQSDLVTGYCIRYNSSIDRVVVALTYSPDDSDRIEVTREDASGYMVKVVDETGCVSGFTLAIVLPDISPSVEPTDSN